MVVAKTRGRGRGQGRGRGRGRGRGVNSPLLLFSNDRHLSFSYGGKKYKKIKEPTEAMKALKGHHSLFFLNRSWFMRASEFVFPKIRRNRSSVFFEIRRISVIGVYVIYANCQRH